MTVTKKYLSKNITNLLSISMKDSASFVDAFLRIIKEKYEYKEIKISNFGTFYKHTSPKKQGRNPVTGKVYLINQLQKLSFKPSNKIKQILN